MLLSKLCHFNRRTTTQVCTETIRRKMDVASDLKTIFLRSVEAVKPANLIRAKVKYDKHNRTLIVNGSHSMNLTRSCQIVGFGKAVLDMALELEDILGIENVTEGGIVSVPEGIFQTTDRNRTKSSRLSFIEGARNNVPDEKSLGAAIQIEKLAESLTRDDVLIVLVSGGGSALLPLPRHPVNLAEKSTLIKELSLRGADIREMNCVRKRFSVLKGGGLAKTAYPANVVALILSDIVGDPLDDIASGPTVQNCDNIQDVLNILQKYSMEKDLPESFKQLLEDDKLSKPSDTNIDCFSRVKNFIIGNNQIAANASFETAKHLNYQSLIVSCAVVGNVETLAKAYVELTRHIIAQFCSKPNSRDHLINFLLSMKNRSLMNDLTSQTIEQIADLKFVQENKGACLVMAGEPTIKVPSQNAGRGGRNQHLALAFSLEIEKVPSSELTGFEIYLLSCGTDGIDGPTDAAGALGSTGLMREALQFYNLNPAEYLDKCDSYGFYTLFKEGLNLIRIGHTGTNVMDLHLLVIIPPKNYKL